MTAPRLLSPFVRTRTRLGVTIGLVMAAALTAASLPLIPDNDEKPIAAQDEPVAAVPAGIGPKDEATALQEARRTGKDVLVDRATTAFSQLFARPDGQLRDVTSALPQRAKDANGQWAPIDNTLSLDPAATDGLGVIPANPPEKVRFSNGGKTASAGAEAGATVLAEAEAKGHTITYTWPGTLPEPVLDGSRALYPEVSAGVDLLLVARQEGGLGLLLIIKNREAAATVKTLTYGLRADGAIFRHNAETGGLSVLDATTQAEIANIPTSMAWDSAGKDPESPEKPNLSTATTADVLKLSGLSGIEPGTKSAPMPATVDGDGTGDIQLHLDAAATGLLTGAGVTFPVYLDPNLNTGEAAWLFVSKSHANSNFWNGTGYNGGTSDARVGHEDDTGVTARSFWRMTFKNIKGATVSSSAFKVLNNHSWSCTAREFQLYYTGAISTGTTWNKQPAWTALQQKVSFAKGYSSSCKDDYVAFNAKDGAQRAATAGATTVTFGMRASTETDTLTWRKFQANTAVLETVYNTTPAEPTSVTTTPGGACVPGPGAGRTVAKTNITLAAVGKDADGNLSKLRFRWWPTGGTVPAGTVVTPDSAGKATLLIPTTSLTDKTTYSWDVRSEDTSSAESTWAPAGTEPCRITIDASAPPAPDVTSDVFLEATADGATWATVKFGQTGPVTFESTGAVKFTFSFSGQEPRTLNATAGKLTVTDLKPRNAGPNALWVKAFDAVGNPSPQTSYVTYVMPSDVADQPHDLTGDKMPDLLVINAEGRLRTCPSQPNGGIHPCLVSSYSTGNKLDPTGHWFDPASGKTSLITKYADTYPGDGTTDLFVRHYDGSFWLYPGDGYGSFNVDQRLKVMLPSNAPATSTWTQIKAVGDITGDKLPDLAIRAGSAFWLLSGYTGASFQTATLMEGTAWSTAEIVNIADVNLDGTPDMTFRKPDTGVMYLRQGKPGTVAGSVTLDSLKTAAASLKGSDAQYGTGWTTANVPVVVGIPDVNGDQIPDIWTRRGDTGIIKVYWPSATDTGTFKDAIITVNWSTMKAFG
ncbi:hypothetical protein ACQP2E_29430 [Actinoplanes sp. CA-015351]|uniref:hypothetical protein n=1 Tax=Actinoplanes sp. CA-015351 TaxID=3239897 RepID=UPI003D974145